MSYQYLCSSDTENEPGILEFPKVSDEVAFRQHMDRRRDERRTASKRVRTSVTKKKARKPKIPMPRAKSSPATIWLKDLICPLVYGEKTPVGTRPSLNKETFTKRWNLGFRLPSLPNYKLVGHFAGTETLFFFANGWKKAKRSLIMIDIDVQKAKKLGSPEGARRFAAHLKSIWPDLYFEPSTGGKGMHGYFVLSKRDFDAQRTNAALKRLEAWLRAEARKVNADIEMVEIKGTCLDLTLENRMVQAVKYGSFAKVPRDVSRFREWENTTVLRACDLESSTFDVVELPEPVADVVTLPSIQKKKQIVPGSVTGKLISDDDLACIPNYERLASAWLGADGLKARKWRVTAHDFAIAMLILRHYKAHPKVDGSLPCSMVGGLWTSLFDAGDVTRPWNHHRWKAIRDFLSFSGHIDWIDNRYEFPIDVVDDKGKKYKRDGICCKWEISDNYDNVLDNVAALSPVERGGGSLMDTKIRQLVPSQGKGQFMIPRPFPLRAEKEQLFWIRAYDECERLYAA